MKRRYYQKQSPLKPLVENIGRRLARADSRFRRVAVKYSLIAFVGFAVYSFLAGPYGFFRISRLENRRQELMIENRELLVALIDSDMRRQRLQSDPHYQEYIARTQYLMARPGETLIRIRR